MCRFGREVTSDLLEDLHALESEAKVAGRFKRVYPECNSMIPHRRADVCNVESCHSRLPVLPSVGRKECNDLGLSLAPSSPKPHCVGA